MIINLEENMNRWHLTDEVRNKIRPLLIEYFDKVENVTVEQVEYMTNEELGIDLSDKGINPSQLEDLLKEFGYEVIRRDDNGWELDFWIDIRRTDGKFFDSGCEHLVISGCGMTFELKIYIYGMDF